MFSDRPGFPATTVPLDLMATFDASGEWGVAPEDFGDGGAVIIPDIETHEPLLPTVDLEVRLRSDASGRHDRSARSIHIDAAFNFQVLIWSSELKIRLDGGTYTLGADQVSGAPIDTATGAVRLAAAGTFSGGKLNGTRCLVQLTGNFQPNPWP